jgi:multidrug efflux pump subunit AcrB
VQPNYWLNPKNGIQYLVNIRVPEYPMDSLEALKVMPISASRPGKSDSQILTNLASFERASGSPISSHYDVMPVIDLFGGVGGRDLGGVLGDIKPLIEEAKKELPKGSFIMLRGQADTMHSSYMGLGIGLVLAVVLIYLLLVVNFQSWLDPFIIITALPGALTGVVWGLYLTLTTLSVPALMGAIMSLGVATANSVLVVTFAGTTSAGPRPAGLGLGSRSRTSAPGAHDGACHDYRHVPHVARSWRRRRAKRTAGSQ